MTVTKVTSGTRQTINEAMDKHIKAVLDDVVRLGFFVIGVNCI